MGLIQALFDDNPAGRLSFATLAIWALGAAILSIFLPVILDASKRPRFPAINWPKWDFYYRRGKANFQDNGLKLLLSGYNKFKQSPFSMITENGPRIMLPSTFLDAVNKEHELDFRAFVTHEFMANYPGFKVFNPAPNTILEDTVRTKLTQNLPKFTEPLCEETTVWFDENWGQSKEWVDTVVKSDIQNIVARLSGLIFVGASLARNPEWQRIAVDFTVDVFTAVQDLRAWPSALRSIACYLLPRCRRLQAEQKRAKQLLAPLVMDREREAAEAVARGKPAPKHNDMLQWVKDDPQRREYDPVLLQLSLTVAAIHTTSDLVAQVLYNLAELPDVVQMVREEAERVLGAHGWSKVAFYQLHLLDSVMKETQRLKPVQITFMNRKALKDVTLPGGVNIKKGEFVSLTNGRHWDESIYTEAQKFDPFRFVKLREQDPDWYHKSHFVATSLDSSGFGHGKHACPGRFFASNESKIILVHMLLNYDIRMKPGTKATVYERGETMTADPFAKIQYRHRQR